MPYVETKTTYLQMFARPTKEVPPPRFGMEVRCLPCPSLETYRELYGTVGAAFGWVDRIVMPDAQLEAILHDELVEVLMLRSNGETAGFAELDRRVEREIELAYFGLYPAFIGQRLGPFFLNWIVRRAWSYEPARVWVHTCDLDHPAALPVYVAGGFEIYREESIRQYLPENHPRLSERLG